MGKAEIDEEDVNVEFQNGKFLLERSYIIDVRKDCVNKFERPNRMVSWWIFKTIAT
jgi:hypothetical protein